jgi:hypothetical protein
MTSTASVLPTVWLAPLERLLPASHKINIQPIPIAISSTIAIVISTIVIVLFSRKRKDMFLEDRIMHAPNNRNLSPTTGHITVTQPTPPVTEIPKIHDPPPTLSTSNLVPLSLLPAPKLDAMLGLPGTSSSRHDRRAQPSPSTHQSYNKPRTAARAQAGYDSDEETLNNWERNSAYLPYPRSDVSEDAREKAPHWLEVPSELRGTTSEFSLASKTRLGDAY